MLHDDAMENKKDSFIFQILINILSFWAMLKYLTFHCLFRINREVIRNKFYGSLWIDVFSKTSRNIRVNATNWRALDDIYNYHQRVEKYGNAEKTINKYWMKMENAQALRNRAKIVKKILHEETEKTLKKHNDNTIKILSIACGSAQPLLEAIMEFSTDEQKKIELTLLDKDGTALENSKILTRKLDLYCQVRTINKTTTHLSELFTEPMFDIIEMVGFLDYRPKNDAIDLIRRIRGILNRNGIFITANIYPNKEKFFLDWVLLWPMIYRNEKQFKEVLLGSGFKINDVRITYEPLKVHQLAVCYNK